MSDGISPLNRAPHEFTSVPFEGNEASLTPLFEDIDHTATVAQRIFPPSLPFKALPPIPVRPLSAIAPTSHAQNISTETTPNTPIRVDNWQMNPDDLNNRSLNAIDQLRDGQPLGAVRVEAPPRPPLNTNPPIAPPQSHRAHSQPPIVHQQPPVAPLGVPVDQIQPPIEPIHPPIAQSPEAHAQPPIDLPHAPPAQSQAAGAAKETWALEKFMSYKKAALVGGIIIGVIQAAAFVSLGVGIVALGAAITVKTGGVGLLLGVPLALLGILVAGAGFYGGVVQIVDSYRTYKGKETYSEQLLREKTLKKRKEAQKNYDADQKIKIQQAKQKEAREAAKAKKKLEAHVAGAPAPGPAPGPHSPLRVDHTHPHPLPPLPLPAAETGPNSPLRIEEEPLISPRQTAHRRLSEEFSAPDQTEDTSEAILAKMQEEWRLLEQELAQQDADDAAKEAADLQQLRQPAQQQQQPEPIIEFPPDD